MLKLILKLLKINYVLGYIENGIFPEKLDDNVEDELIKNLFIKEKHDQSRKKLIIHNLRLVGHIAKKYESKDDSYDDLISIGTIGLIKAIDTYTPSKLVKLATYASRCIENEILMVLRSNKKHSKDILLTDSIGKDKEGEDIILEDIICNDDSTINDDFDKKEKIKALKQFISVLDDKEYKIIALRYGLDNHPEYTQKEIGKMYHISRSYVSRIEKRALIKLYQEFKKQNKEY